MCYGSGCPWERRDGECGRRAGQPCPEDFETAEEFWDAKERREEERAEYLYEQKLGRV